MAMHQLIAATEGGSCETAMTMSKFAYVYTPLLQC